MTDDEAEMTSKAPEKSLGALVDAIMRSTSGHDTKKWVDEVGQNALWGDARLLPLWIGVDNGAGFNGDWARRWRTDTETLS